MIPAFLIVYDQFWKGYRSPISLWRDCTQKPGRDARSGMRRKGGLFDHRDPIASR